MVIDGADSTDEDLGTVNFDHIKRHYYVTHDDINPTRIVPLGPKQDFTTTHGRERSMFS